MAIHLVFITYNRLYYTKLALASVLADPTEEFALTIWDNGSTDGTVDYLKNEVSDRRIVEMVFSKENIGQIKAVNNVWSRSKADLLGKLDNDCLVTAGWTRVLEQAHHDIPELGVVACWPFSPGEFDYERAKRKIQKFGRHQILRHPWTCGTGLLVKRDIYQKLGPIEGDANATTQYWLKMAMAGYVNGFYYPLIYQEHMDDLSSRYNAMLTLGIPFEQAYRYCPAYQQGWLRDQLEYKQCHRQIVENILSGPYDPYFYVGWRRKWRSATRRIARLLKRYFRCGL